MIVGFIRAIRSLKSVVRTRLHLQNKSPDHIMLGGGAIGLAEWKKSGQRSISDDRRGPVP